MPTGKSIATTNELRASVWARIEKAPGPDGCWLWTGAKFKSGGYGAIKVGGRKGPVLRVHRLVWEWENGPIPDDLFLCHRCDNPPCCRPSHMFTGSAADNLHDAERKGRWIKTKFRPKTHKRGEDNHFAVLTEEDVIEIRRRYSEEKTTYFKLASEYGVSFTNIAAIVTRRSWQHVP